MTDSSLKDDSLLTTTLQRLSLKAGVKATVVLDRERGSILKKTGNFSSRGRTSSNAAAPINNEPSPNLTREPIPTTEAEGIEDLAAMVWNFVNSAGGLVTGLDTEDELKLLRLRTKKHELVIVPDPKYLFIVVHDTPPA